MTKIHFLTLLWILWSSASQALILEDLVAKGTVEATFSHKKVGYYIGSFDPLHKGHEEVAELAVKQGLCDYVLIFPAWGGDSYKNRVDVRHRLEMLYAVFANHPSVIVTKLSPQEMQKVFTCPDTDKMINDKPVVKPAIDGLEFIGVIGSDTALSLQPNEKALSTFMRGIQVPEKYQETTIGSVIALPVKSFIVAQRDDDDLKPLNNMIGDRPIIAIIESKLKNGLSSTKVKNNLKQGEAIDDMVHSSVKRIIEKEKLYQG